MFNPLTQLNNLFDAFAARSLSGHDQLICLHIFNKLNRARWPETVRISDRELQELCQLYDSNGKPVSLDTIRRAKSRLKLKGFIDYPKGTGLPTEYRMTVFSPCRHPADTPADSPAEKLAAYWNRTLGGARLNFEDISWLDALINRHGYEWAKDLLDEAYRANGNRYGLSPKWLHEVCERRLKPLNSKPKGGDKRGRSVPVAGQSTAEYNLRGTDTVPEWADD